MLSLPVPLAKQDVTAFAYSLLIDLCRFRSNGVFWDAEHNGDVQNFGTLFAHQTGSDSILLPFIV